MEYKVDKPYPEIKVLKKNLFYAQLLLDDYVSEASEETSIQQYIYQSFLYFDTLPELSQTLARIAMVEMRHLELLGKTIKLLGVKPEFKYVDKSKKRLSWWSSSFVDYKTNLKDMLISDIELEIKAIKSYQNHIKIIDDKYIKSLLKRIIEDEILHIKCFKEMLSTVEE